jgi:uncharacterized protein
MTPVLVLFFGVPPLAAVSSDLVVSAVMKPVGAWVHLRRGTVNRAMVGWLCLGSVPAAFGGVLVARALGDGEPVQQVIKTALGVALLLAAVGLIAKSYLALRDRSVRRARRAAGPPDSFDSSGAAPARGRIRPLPTVLVGAVGGLVVGTTSVGSGSLIIIALLALYPTLKSRDLVGTDVVQAVPLVVSAAIAHLLFGDFRMDRTVAVLAGAIPGVFVGAQMSSHLPDGFVRRALALILLVSGLKLFGVGDNAMMLVVGSIIVVGPVLWVWARRSHGLTAFARAERRAPADF